MILSSGISIPETFKTVNDNFDILKESRGAGRKV